MNETTLWKSMTTSHAIVVCIRCLCMGMSRSHAKPAPSRLPVSTITKRTDWQIVTYHHEWRMSMYVCLFFFGKVGKELYQWPKPKHMRTIKCTSSFCAAAATATCVDTWLKPKKQLHTPKTLVAFSWFDHKKHYKKTHMCTHLSNTNRRFNMMRLVCSQTSHRVYWSNLQALMLEKGNLGLSCQQRCLSSRTNPQNSRNLNVISSIYSANHREPNPGARPNQTRDCRVFCWVYSNSNNKLRAPSHEGSLFLPPKPVEHIESNIAQSNNIP